MGVLRDRKELNIELHRDTSDWAVEWHLAQPEGPFLQRLSRFVLESFDRELGDVRGKRMLLVCGGSGYEAARYESKGAWVVNSDLSEEMCRISRIRAGREGLTYDAVTADAENLPFREGAFSVSMVYGGLHHVPNLTLGLSEICRVASESVALYEPAGNALRRLLNRFTKSTIEYDGLSPNTFTKYELFTALSKAGFAEPFFLSFFYHFSPDRILKWFNVQGRIESFHRLMMLLNRIVGPIGLSYVAVGKRKATG